MATPSAAQDSARQRYERLTSIRDPYLKQARDSAALTIPALVPPEGQAGTAALLAKPFQSVGAHGVNNLASKLLLVVFPAGASFFRLRLTADVLRQLKESIGEEGFAEAKAEFEKALSEIEIAVVHRLEEVGARLSLFEAMKQLLVAGNCVIQFKQDGKLKLHFLSNFVVRRDASGSVLELIIKENIAREALPDEVRALVEKNGPDKDNAPDKEGVDLFTHIRREGSKYNIHQEIVGVRVPKSEGTYPIDKCPWLALRFTSVDGEDYGRGFVEQYYGDLFTLDSLRQSIVEGAAISAKTLFFVNPGGVTSAQELQDAPNGGILEGDAEKDITTLQAEKAMDLSVAKALAEELKQDLAKAFLLNSSVQRQAERVTAEEVRFLANELEQAFGGVYSVFSQELQLPMAVIYLAHMQRGGKLPHLPKDAVKPQIITGLDALGRTGDLMRLDALIRGLAADVGQDAVAEYINVGGLARRKATALGIDIEGIVRSEEEVQASRQASSQQEMLGKLGGPAMQAMSKQAAPVEEAA